ncbi:hypothetical protein Tco_0741314 [Tanacetum coccineum]
MAGEARRGLFRGGKQLSGISIRVGLVVEIVFGRWWRWVFVWGKWEYEIKNTRVVRIQQLARVLLEDPPHPPPLDSLWIRLGIDPVEGGALLGSTIRDGVPSTPGPQDFPRDNATDADITNVFTIDQGVGSTSGIRASALRNFDLEVMELEKTQNNALAKLPMLKLGEYAMWEIMIKQYFQIQDYALWEVIENGNSWVPIPVTTPSETGTSTGTKMTMPSTIEEKT